MGKILDLVTIKFDFKMKGSFLAKVTLNWQDEFEVRFCRLTMRPDSTLWFQPPALKEFGWAKCFAVLDEKKWKDLESKVCSEFMKELQVKVDEETISPAFLEKLNKSKEQIITEEDLDKIDKEINEQHN